MRCRCSRGEGGGGLGVCVEFWDCVSRHVIYISSFLFAWFLLSKGARSRFVGEFRECLISWFFLSIGI